MCLLLQERNAFDASTKGRLMGQSWRRNGKGKELHLVDCLGVSCDACVMDGFVGEEEEMVIMAIYIVSFSNNLHKNNTETCKCLLM